MAVGCRCCRLGAARPGLAEGHRGRRARAGLRDCPGCRGCRGRLRLPHVGRSAAAPRGVCDCWRLSASGRIPC
eukprot:11029172-Alexandrium_andersonii.AAC.1